MRVTGLADGCRAGEPARAKPGKRLAGIVTAAPSASAALGKKFGSGATVSKTPTGGQEIDIQGDMSGELPDVLVALFGVPEAAIVVRD